MHVTLQVFAFQEGPGMMPTLTALADQPVPDGITVDQQVWVTPSTSNTEACDTWQAALASDGWSVHEAPAGKLSARNAGHDHAVEQGADAIACIDADAPPQTEKSVAKLVSPLVQENVAGVNGLPVAPPSPVGLLTNAVGFAHDMIQPHLHGQCHAFTSQAWRQAGPFSTDLDETTVHPVRAEEEFAFRRRVEQVGRVVDAMDARFRNDTRRSECRVRRLRTKFGADPDPYCSRVGTETFAPQNYEPRRRNNQ